MQTFTTKKYNASNRIIFDASFICLAFSKENDLSRLIYAFGIRQVGQKAGKILAARFRLEPGDPVAIETRMKELAAKRQEKQPLEYPSAGSTFKRPEGYFAAALIDQCGLKGLTVGGAQVSEKHAGFVINRGGATCSDILTLVEQIRERVKSSTGVELELEVKILR